jgi:hypothetical protein
MLAAGVSAAAMPATAICAAVAGVTDPLLTYLRIRSRLDGKRAFYPYRGTIFGRPFGRSAVPLFDVEGFSWDRLTPVSEGHFKIDTAEAGYFVDPKTRLPLDRWINPLNGVETQVKHYRSFAHVIASDGKLEPVMGPTPVPGLQMTATMTPPTILNDRIWVHEDLIVRFPNKPATAFADAREYAGPTLEAASLATWSADVRDLADKEKTFVPATLAYQTLGSWRPFMRMGNTPGLISWRMFGSKEPSVERVPNTLLERVLRDYPDFLTRNS